MNEFLTIAIPVYNRDAYFRQALESALNQTVPVRVVVVDNASDKVDFRHILSACSRPGLSYERNPANLGMVENWNRCIELCETRYLLILHDDDFLETDYVQNFLRVRDETAQLYWTNAGIVDQKGDCIRSRSIPDMEAYQDVTRWCLHNPAFAGIIFDVGKARELGGFRVTLRFTPDWDLWFRLRISGRAIQVPQRGVWYREYVGEDRCTSQLRGSYKFFFYGRNQVKRNFSRINQRQLYKRLLYSGTVPGVSVRELMMFAPTLHLRKLRYFAATARFTSPQTASGHLLRVGLRFFGWRLFRVLQFLGYNGRTDGGGRRSSRPFSTQIPRK